MTTALQPYEDAALAVYRTECAREGVDPDMDLLTGQLAHGVPARRWAALRLAWGLDPAPRLYATPADILRSARLRGGDMHRHACAFLAAGTTIERVIVAGSEHCPPELLTILVADPDPVVRRRVAEHTTDPDLLDRLAGDPEASVRVPLVNNTGCPTSILRLLAGDPHPHVRRAVACNKRTPCDIVDALMSDPDSTVRGGAEETVWAMFNRLPSAGGS